MPDENAVRRSWAKETLQRCLYDKDPTKLQMIIRHLYETATKQIRVSDVDVIPVPLFMVLDGQCTSDYTARVEPSERGGLKIAKFLQKKLRG